MLTVSPKLCKFGKHDSNDLRPIPIPLPLSCRQLPIIFLWLSGIPLGIPVEPDENSKTASESFPISEITYISC